MFHGALGVVNFFVSTRHALYSIPALKLLAIFKSAKLDFFFVFFERIRVVGGCFPASTTLPIFS